MKVQYLPSSRSAEEDVYKRQVPYIAGGQPERQLECSVLLVGIQTAAFAYGKCLPTEILKMCIRDRYCTFINRSFLA